VNAPVPCGQIQPDEPVPYTLTDQAEPVELPDPDPEVGNWPGWSDQAMHAPAREPAPEAEAEEEEEAQLEAAYEAEWADEWDSADSSAYMDRVEAGLEPEAEL
jgi:hypothetical protein